MECLDIPVDHRLTSLIRRMNIPNRSEKSTHIEILKDWAGLRQYDGAPVPSTVVHHALELAKPATKGGILVALLQPHQKQKFNKGFTADLHSCATTSAVSDLVETVTGGRMGADDVSVFDALPFCPDGTEDGDILQDAQDVFRRMVEAKQPDVVLCCYKDPSTGVLKDLSSLGVGKVFTEEDYLLGGDFTTKRVNAFHPSYAVHFHPTYSCFRRLLVAEFAQAFSHFSEAGLRADWVTKLREDCRRRASELSSKKKPKWGTLDEIRWSNILGSLDEKLSSLDYFCGGVGVDKVVHTELSWACADASLFLTQAEKLKGKDPNGISNTVSLLLDHFGSWYENTYTYTYTGVELGDNGAWTTSDSHGYFKPESLWKAAMTSLPEESPAHELPTHFSAFLNDLNFSFSWVDKDLYTWDIAALRNAFKRFAVNLERASGRNNPSLSDRMRALRI